MNKSLSIFEYILNISFLWLAKMTTPKPTQKEAVGQIAKIVNLVLPLELLGIILDLLKFRKK